MQILFDKISIAIYLNGTSMNSSQIRNEAKNYIDQLSPDKLILVIDFLKDLQEEDDVDATEELLNIPGFESAFKKAKQQVKNGKTKDWPMIRDDV
ncbi:MAG: hypothetical protein AAF652_03530 [Cyanobacteria bacterium P01_C01_bin.72]